MLNYLKNVTTLKLDREKCIGCGMCAEVCPHGVFLITQHKAEICHRDDCMECGACKRNCPAEAIEVDAGVGCASGILNGMLRGAGACCNN